MKENLGLLASDLATISSKAEPFLATYSAVLSAISIQSLSYDSKAKIGTSDFRRRDNNVNFSASGRI